MTENMLLTLYWMFRLRMKEIVKPIIFLLSMKQPFKKWAEQWFRMSILIDNTLSVSVGMVFASQPQQIGRASCRERAGSAQCADSQDRRRRKTGVTVTW